MLRRREDRVARGEARIRSPFAKGPKLIVDAVALRGSLPSKYRASAMAAAKKKKPKIQASDVAVGNRTLEGVLIDLAEQIKANDARYAERSAQAEERSARIEELSAQAAARSARAEELSAQAAARSAQAEALATIALQTIAAVTQDIRALARRTDERLGAVEDRLGAVEKTIAAE